MPQKEKNEKTFQKKATKEEIVQPKSKTCAVYFIYPLHWLRGDTN